MKLKRLSEIIWNIYQDGKPDANKQKLAQTDIAEMCRMSAANNFRQQFLFGQKVIPGKKLIPVPDEGDYYFLSPLLSIRKFDLSEPDEMGVRVADMKEFDLYRLPKNEHLKNITMVNAVACGLRTGDITLVKNGEEKFYAGKPKFKNYIFAAPSGRTLRTFNVPPCIKTLAVESTFDTPDDQVDITLDVAYDITTEVLRLTLGVEESTGEAQVKMREQLKKEEEIK